MWVQSKRLRAPTVIVTMHNYKQKILHILHFSRHTANKQVGVEVEAICAVRTLALNVRLIVHPEHSVATGPRHHQLMPTALTDLYFTDQGTCSRTRVEPEEIQKHFKLILHSSLRHTLNNICLYLEFIYWWGIMMRDSTTQRRVTEFRVGISKLCDWNKAHSRILSSEALVRKWPHRSKEQWHMLTHISGSIVSASICHK